MDLTARDCVGLLSRVATTGSTLSRPPPRRGLLLVPLALDLNASLPARYLPMYYPLR